VFTSALIKRRSLDWTPVLDDNRNGSRLRGITGISQRRQKSRSFGSLANVFSSPSSPSQKPKLGDDVTRLLTKFDVDVKTSWLFGQSSPGFIVRITSDYGFSSQNGVNCS